MRTGEWLCVGLLAAGLLWGVGCAWSPQPDVSVPIVVMSGDYDAAYQSSIAVLRDQGFGLDRRDYRNGVVSSESRGAGTLLEVWDANHTGLRQAGQSTLNDHRRTVTVLFEPLRSEMWEAVAEEEAAAAQPPYSLEVVVLIERRQDPTRRLGGAVHGQVFTELGDTPAELAARGIEGPYWQPVGRDVKLEQKITQKILDRMASQQ